MAPTAALQVNALRTKLGAPQTHRTPARLGRGPEGKRRAGAGAASERPRVALIVASASPRSWADKRHAARTRQPGRRPRGRFKPPLARRLARTRQLKFLRERRLRSTSLKTRARGCHERSHEVQPRRPTTPGRAPTRCADPGPLGDGQRVVFLSGLSQPPGSPSPEKAAADKKSLSPSTWIPQLQRLRTHFQTPLTSPTPKTFGLP